MLMTITIMTGLMAGIYFTFSVFVMKALASLPPIEGARAMNRINLVILKTVFLPLFFISTLAHALLLSANIFLLEPGGETWLNIASILYLAGMFLVTLFGNVPLNNQLLHAAEIEDDLVNEWQQYLKRWTRLNHIRTASCTLSLALLIHVLSTNSPPF